MKSNIGTWAGFAAAVITILVMFGCAADPVSTSKTDNKAVQVDKLFTHDGCTVYRFEDNGESHYYAVCDAGRSVSTSSEIPAGKSSRPEEIATEQR